MEYGSKEICKAAVRLALSEGREEEKEMKNYYLEQGIKTVAVDFGSDFNSAVPKIIERAVVAAKREGLIAESHAEEGAVAGAAHEALQMILNKCVGLNLGGKIGIARCAGHISVCLFFAIGLLNLNDVTIGIGHRAV
ncbi:MAG: HutP family protein [Clostridia bacterium]|nr:HutP family protein [Clostridia bacterium]